MFYDLTNFMLQILVNIFRQIKMKIKSFGFYYYNLPSMYTPIIIMTWLKFCKMFLWFYYADTKDIVFIWFFLLVCLNNFQLLFGLIILKAWLIVCLGLRFLILFLLLIFLPPHLLVAAWLVLFHRLLEVMQINLHNNNNQEIDHWYCI